MPVNDVLEVAYVCYNLFQNALNIVHFRVIGVGATEPTLAEKALAANNGIGPVIKSCVSANWGYRGVKVRVVRPTPTAIILDTTNAGAGALVGDPLPPQICAVLSVRAATAPSRTRGRFYVPAPTEAENTNTATPSVGYQTTLGALVTALKTDIAVAGAGGATCTLRPVLMKKTAPVNDYQITQVLIRNYWGTQRRRSRINRDDVPAM